MWKLNMLLNKQWVKKKPREIKKYLQKNKNRNTTYLNLRYVAKASKREVHSNKFLHQKQEISQINNQSLYLKEVEKREKNQPKLSIRKEVKIRVEINEIESKKAIEKNTLALLLCLTNLSSVIFPREAIQVVPLHI